MEIENINEINKPDMEKVAEILLGIGIDIKINETEYRKLDIDLLDEIAAKWHELV